MYGFDSLVPQAQVLPERGRHRQRAKGHEYLVQRGLLARGGFDTLVPQADSLPERELQRWWAGDHGHRGQRRLSVQAVAVRAVQGPRVALPV